MQLMKSSCSAVSSAQPRSRTSASVLEGVRVGDGARCEGMEGRRGQGLLELSVRKLGGEDLADRGGVQWRRESDTGVHPTERVLSTLVMYTALLFSYAAKVDRVTSGLSGESAQVRPGHVTDGVMFQRCGPQLEELGAQGKRWRSSRPTNRAFSRGLHRRKDRALGGHRGAAARWSSERAPPRKLVEVCMRAGARLWSTCAAGRGQQAARPGRRDPGRAPPSAGLETAPPTATPARSRAGPGSASTLAAARRPKPRSRPVASRPASVPAR